MPGNAAIRVPRIPVIHFAYECVLAPAIPGARITIVVVPERGVVDHLPFVWVAMRSSGEVLQPARFGQEGRTAQAERRIQLIAQEGIQPLAANPIDDVA